MENAIETRRIGDHQYDTERLETADMNSAQFRAVTMLEGAIDAVHTKAKEIGRDPHLSEAGKAAKTAPLADKAIDELLAAREELDQQASEIAAREAKLYAVGNASNAIEAEDDRELRTWWRSLDADTRMALLQKLADDGEAGDATFNQYESLWKALQRFPSLPGDRELPIVRDVWQRTRRLNDPGTWAEIEKSRNLLKWAEKAFGHLHGISQRVTGKGMQAITDRAVTMGREKTALRLGANGDMIALARARNR